MYLFFGLFLIAAILCCFSGRRRKCGSILRLCSMDLCSKICLLNQLMEPFGFSYAGPQDVITSRVDAWQREFGYRGLFDRSAVRFNMVFDCEPIYFNYQNRTWLIELWKGQYGINTGSEIGIYRADSLLTPGQYSAALFQAVPDEEMLPISMELLHHGRRLFTLDQDHWWLTGFCIGHFCDPAELVMHASITFPDCSMQQSFVKGLLDTGYRRCDLNICGRTVAFVFDRPFTSQPGVCRPLASRFAQWKNRMFCRLYCRITRPFTTALDQILYLYFLLPFAFRHTLRIRRNRRQRPRRK